MYVEFPVISKSLILQFRKGDKGAFNRITTAYYVKIRSYVRNRLRNYPQIDQEALIQDLWLKMWELHSKPAYKTFNGWVFAIMRNLCSEAIRKTCSEHRVQKQLECEKDIFYEDKDIDEVNEVNNTLSELPQIYSEVLRLKYFEGKSYDEIAEILSIPIGTVRSRISKAKQLFKEKYESAC